MICHFWILPSHPLLPFASHPSLDVKLHLFAHTHQQYSHPSTVQPRSSSSQANDSIGTVYILIRKSALIARVLTSSGRRDQ